MKNVGSEIKGDQKAYDNSQEVNNKKSGDRKRTSC